MKKPIKATVPENIDWAVSRNYHYDAEQEETVEVSLLKADETDRTVRLSLTPDEAAALAHAIQRAAEDMDLYRICNHGRSREENEALK